MKILVIILVAVIIGGIASMMYIRKNRDKFILDGPGMINTRENEIVGVSYSYGGGMEGESLYYSLTVSENGTTSLFEYSNCQYNGADTVTATKEVSVEYFNNIRIICRQTECLLQAHNGKPSELQLLDAPTSHITFTMLNGELISLHNNYDYHSSCNGLFGMITAEMQNILDNEIQPEDIITTAEN
ncbi:MAG: hypothetical protein IKY30_08505 [Oscillospiraceae bacterium]|nr:hypothetical protein [Oscillospiraceae bacterium]